MTKKRPRFCWKCGQIIGPVEWLFHKRQHKKEEEDAMKKEVVIVG